MTPEQRNKAAIEQAKRLMKAAQQQVEVHTYDPQEDVVAALERENRTTYFMGVIRACKELLIILEGEERGKNTKKR